MTTINVRLRRTRRRRSGALLAVVLLAAACSDGDDVANEPASTTTTSTTNSPTTTPSTTTPSTTTARVDADEADPVVDCTSVPRGMSEFVLEAGGAEHDVRLYVPSTYDGTSELPLVMDFHGFGSNGRQQAALTGYEELAEDEGFVVVHPTAVPASGDEQRRNSWETVELDDPAKDDIAFTEELIDLLVEDYCVDATRVYATGMSGGGLFTSQLVCEMSDRLAAAVSVAAISYPESCDPVRPVPFIAIHGTDDPTVPFDGDLTGTRFEGEAFTQLLFSEPMPEQFGRFAVAMGCNPEGERVQESTDIATTTYRGCDDDVPLVFYEVIGGGHAWPSSPLAEPDSPVVAQLTALQGYTTFEINATTDAWAFFEQHALEG
ncbi:MAG: PHB depolymerase family esterase [Acidimicrobiales bacterium]